MTKDRYLWIIYLIFFLAIVPVTVVLKADMLSFAYLTITMAGIYINSRRIRYGLLVFALGSALYIYISFVNKFYGEAVINAVITVYYIVSFFLWKKSAADNRIKGAGRVFVIILLAAFAVFVPLYMLALKSFGTSQPLINSISTGVNIISVIFTARRILYQYLAWAALNIVQIILWLTTFNAHGTSYLPIVAFNVFFLGINIHNFIMWLKTYKRENTNDNGNQSVSGGADGD